MNKTAGINTYGNVLPVNNRPVDSASFYKYLVQMRARRENCFINDRGFRHIKNDDDKTGMTYAFWLIKDTK